MSSLGGNSSQKKAVGSYDKPWRDAMSKPKKKKDHGAYRDSMSNPLPEGDDSIAGGAVNEYRDTIGSPPAFSQKLDSLPIGSRQY